MGPLFDGVILRVLPMPQQRVILFRHVRAYHPHVPTIECVCAERSGQNNGVAQRQRILFIPCPQHAATAQYGENLATRRVVAAANVPEPVSSSRK